MIASLPGRFLCPGDGALCGMKTQSTPCPPVPCLQEIPCAKFPRRYRSAGWSLETEMHCRAPNATIRQIPESAHTASMPPRFDFGDLWTKPYPVPCPVRWSGSSHAPRRISPNRPRKVARYREPSSRRSWFCAPAVSRDITSRVVPAGSVERLDKAFRQRSTARSNATAPRREAMRTRMSHLGCVPFRPRSYPRAPRWFPGRWSTRVP